MRSKASVHGRSLTGIVGSNPTEGMDVCVVSVVCCQVEVSATGWSLVQRSPTECGVSKECVIVKPRRNEEALAHIGLSSHRKKNYTLLLNSVLTLIFISLLFTVDMPHNSAVYVFEYRCFLRMATNGSRNMWQCFCKSNIGAVSW
jgi:hypothetical protein